MTKNITSAGTEGGGGWGSPFACTCKQIQQLDWVPFPWVKLNAEIALQEGVQQILFTLYSLQIYSHLLALLNDSTEVTSYLNLLVYCNLVSDSRSEM